MAYKDRTSALNTPQPMYAKIFTQIYDGTLCTRGPWQALVTFQQLLVLADQDGNVDMTAEAIARRTTIPAEIIRIGIEALMLPDPESRTPTEEGRRIVPLSEGRTWGWHVVNYEHYRRLKREEDRRDYHREYWRNKRARSTDSTRHYKFFCLATARSLSLAVLVSTHSANADPEAYQCRYTAFQFRQSRFTRQNRPPID
jgi:hypothetical protein